MKLLYISSIDYYFAPRARAHYFGELLSKWHTVDFISFPDWYALLQVVKRRQRFIKTQKERYPNFHSHYVLRLPLNRFKIILYLNNLIKKIYFVFLCKNNRYDYIILMNPIDYKLLPKNISAKLVYDCEDKIDGHIVDSKLRKEINKAEQELTQRARFITCASEPLRLFLERYRKQIIVIKNGIDLKLFQNISFQKSNQKEKTHVYRFGFIGAITYWVDVNFIKKIAEKLPQVQFYFIGPLTYSLRDIENGKNIFYLGVRPHKDIPALIKNFDICLLPFKINDVSKYSNPIKIYEYLALGKPVLARYWPELKNEFGDLIYYYDNDSEFIEISRKLMHQNEPEDLIKRRILFANRNSWQENIKLFNQLLEKNYSNF